jgi:hypothetical protein
VIIPLKHSQVFVTSDTLQGVITQLRSEIPKLEANPFTAADIEKAAGLTANSAIAAAA